ncbi:hypothetical protein [Embleya sp. NPDC020630]|uniref:hypothetical protein n=1 Tax=Embleya sp. NPDC020630 TaxID=3363979 RepID=UPI003798B45C
MTRRCFGAPGALDTILEALAASADDDGPTYPPTWRAHDGMRVCDRPDGYRGLDTKHLTPEQHRRIHHILG